VIPLDGPQVNDLYASTVLQNTTITLFSASLFIICGLVFSIVIFRTKGPIRQRSVPFLTMCILGCLIFVASVFVSAKKPSKIYCSLNIWFLVIGFGLIHSALISRELLLFSILHATSNYVRKTASQLNRIPFSFCAVSILVELV
jgi:hypothetical protein